MHLKEYICNARWYLHYQKSPFATLYSAASLQPNFLGSLIREGIPPLLIACVHCEQLLLHTVGESKNISTSVDFTTIACTCWSSYDYDRLQAKSQGTAIAMGHQRWRNFKFTCQRPESLLELSSLHLSKWLVNHRRHLRSMWKHMCVSTVWSRSAEDSNGESSW